VSATFPGLQDTDVRRAYLKLALHHPDKAASSCKVVSSIAGAPSSCALQERLRMEANAVFKLVQDAKDALARQHDRNACQQVLAREAVLHGFQ
jgi:hypothetical protein